MPEHHLASDGYRASPLTMLAAIAPLEHFMLFVPPGMPMKQFSAYAELFAKEVMPAFR